ncbi:MAG: hypothetical protein R3F20_19515 [Planctomycetota bacterium]
MLRIKTTALLAIVALGSCSSGPDADSRRVEQEEYLLDRADRKSWIDFEEVADETERASRIRRAIALSRSTMAPYYDGLIARSDAALERVAAARREAAARSEAPGTQDEKIPEPSSDFVFEFRDAPIEEVCYLVAEEIGLKVLIAIDMPETVTASFPGVDARRGLDAILDGYGYRLIEKDGIHTVARDDGGPLETRTFHLKTGVRIDVGTQLQPLAGRRGQITILPDNRAVLVTATADGLKRVGDYLETLDRRPRQVVIEALVVEVARGNTLRRGVDISFDEIDLGSPEGSVSSSFLPAAVGGAANPFLVGLLDARNAISFMLAADEGIDRLNVLHSPFISTLTGKQASLQVIERIPYVQATTSIGADEGSSAGTVTSSEEIEFAETGVTLEVTPNIGTDDIVDIYVKPTIEELVGFVSGVPVIDTRSAETNLMVRNGETVVLGGLLRNSFRRSESGVPILKDIPLLGELFRRVETEDEKVELMIFLTPHIIGYGMESDPHASAQAIYLNEPAGFRGVKKVMERRRRDHAGRRDE